MQAWLAPLGPCMASFRPSFTMLAFAQAGLRRVGLRPIACKPNLSPGCVDMPRSHVCVNLRLVACMQNSSPGARVYGFTPLRACISSPWPVHPRHCVSYIAHATSLRPYGFANAGLRHTGPRQAGLASSSPKVSNFLLAMASFLFPNAAFSHASFATLASARASFRNFGLRPCWPAPMLACLPFLFNKKGEKSEYERHHFTAPILKPGSF